MKLYTLFFFTIFFSATLFSQNIPEVKLDNKTYLKLSNLHIKVNITGNVALTTYNMKFYNGTNRVLEGELAFPLGQGQTVTDFAMDVNGQLRHAVIVEKELGRVAYENTIRQTIDPGLLEMTKGDNYKTRVYPIPAKGYKELEITYEQILYANDSKHKYILPLQFTKPLSNFSLEIAIHDKKHVRLNETKFYKSLKFFNQNGIKKASFKAENFIPRAPINIEMQLDTEESVTTYNGYFNIYKSLIPKTKLKNKPKTITLLWDASYSMEYRKINKEVAFLDKYFGYLKSVRVNLVVFNIKVKRQKSFLIKNGDWGNLKKEIESVVYDGGTSFKKLNTYKSDEYLMFTDGMFNLGDFDIPKNTSIYTINAVISANHNRLAQISTQAGGRYINLSNQSVASAVNTVKNQVYQFLGILENDDVYSLYPKKITNVKEDFSLSGKFKKNTILKLLFGHNNKATDTVLVAVSKGVNNRLVKRIWAKEKLNSLIENTEKNKDDIIKLAKKNHLITTYTSMIILDRIEDYVRYKIEPPSELKAEYKELVRAADESEQFRLADIESRKNDLYHEYEALFDWYNKDFSKVKKAAKVEAKTEIPLDSVIRTPVETENQTNLTVNNSAQQPTNDIDLRAELDPAKPIVSGNVIDANGSPIPGVTIYIIEKVEGTVSDFDGHYSLNAEPGDHLVFLYVGFISHEVILNTNMLVNVTLIEHQSHLDEVVVMGYGTARKMELTSSFSSVKPESIEEIMSNSMINSLQGKLAGVSIQSNSGQSGSSSTITIKGYNSINNSEPLYVVDGVPFTEEDFKNIGTAEIKYIRVLKNGDGASIYGSKASNGVVLITTKVGLKEKKEIIKALNEKIDKEIEFKPWSSNADYINDISKSETTEEAYSRYLVLRNMYKNTPTFFMDVAEYFDTINEKEIALQIVTNLIEIEVDNHELIRALGYKLEYFKSFDLAVYVYEEVLKLRPEEPQSYRDLALVYEEIGEYQKAFDLLYKIIDGELLEKDEDERFYGIEHLAYVEACHLASKHGENLNLSKSQSSLIKEFNLDIRVVIDWNHNNTDLDLWVENPEEEKVLFSNKSGKDGGRLSEDLTEGYGPEEFMIKKAKKGNYEILIDYYGDDVQKISGPTALKVTIFTNYGQKNETKEIRVLRLAKEEEEIEVGTVSI